MTLSTANAIDGERCGAPRVGSVESCVGDGDTWKLWDSMSHGCGGGPGSYIPQEMGHTQGHGRNKQNLIMQALLSSWYRLCSVCCNFLFICVHSLHHWWEALTLCYGNRKNTMLSRTERVMSFWSPVNESLIFSSASVWPYFSIRL